MLTPGTSQPDRRSQGLGQVSESSKSSNCSLRKRRKVSSAIQCYCGELLYARKHQSQHVRDRNTQRLPPPSPRSCQPSPIPSRCLTLLPGVMSNESGRFKWTLRHRNKASRIFIWLTVMRTQYVKEDQELSNLQTTGATPTVPLAREIHQQGEWNCLLRPRPDHSGLIRYPQTRPWIHRTYRPERTS